MLTLDRDVRLSGVRASRRLSTWGWSAEPASQLHIFGDHLASDRITVGRFWTTARRLTWKPSSGTTVLVAFAVEGAPRAGERGRILTPECALVSGGEGGAVLETLSAVSVLFVEIQAPDHHGTLQIVDVPGDLRQIVYSFVTALLNSSAELELGSRALVLEALQRLIESVCRLGLPRPPASRRRGAVTAEDVRQAIAERLEDSEFSVEHLAKLLAVSRAQLFRLLKPEGTTPMRELARLRIERARLLLAEGDDSLGEVAARSGFRTVRAMRAALDRDAARGAAKRSRTSVTLEHV